MLCLKQEKTIYTWKGFEFSDENFEIVNFIELFISLWMSFLIMLFQIILMELIKKN